MAINVFNEIEKECEINLDWFYHSKYYDKDKYKSILTEGLKCNELLNISNGGLFNGPYYISLSKMTIPDNECFLTYVMSRPSFIINGIQPIKCEDNDEYLDYVYTKDPRRIGSCEEEYQYYYLIENIYISGIVYNFYSHFIKEINRFDRKKVKELLDLISLLEELDMMNLPIYDYSRREKTLAYTIDKERLKYYSKDIL